MTDRLPPTPERLCVMSDIPAVYGYGPVERDTANKAFRDLTRALEGK